MKALRDVFGDTLVSLGSTNPNVLVLDADLANSTKADKFAIAYPGRFLQMGIAEQNFIGVAVGLASLGFVPWLSSFTVFFTHSAIDTIRMLLAQTHANVNIGAAYYGLFGLGYMYEYFRRKIPIFDLQNSSTIGRGRRFVDFNRATKWPLFAGR